METPEQACAQTGADAFGMGALAWLTGDRTAPRDRAPAHRAAAAEVTHRTVPAPDRRDGTVPVPENLRPRELEVLALMCRGMLAREIGVELGIRACTVVDHQRALFRAFGVGSGLALVAKVFNTGFVKPRTEPTQAKGA